VTTAATTVTSLTVETDVLVPMADGVRLSTQILRPNAPGGHPAILMRTQYGKSVSGVSGAGYLDPFELARSGWVVVAQDCRGTGRSAGRFRQFHDEAADGAATIAWLADQDWSDGTVVMIGGSYLATTQSLAATRTPPALRALAASWGASDFYDGFAYRGGAFEFGFALRWSAEAAFNDASRRVVRGEDVGRDREQLAPIVADMWGAYEQLPLKALPDRVALMASYGEWLAHPTRDEYWRAISVRDRFEAFEVPTLQIAGWSDVRLKGSLENFVGLRDRAGTRYARENQRLIVTPWGHNPEHPPVSEVVGDLWFGREAGALAASDIGKRITTFLGAAVRGEPVDLPPVRIFVMGANVWRDEEDWPLARAVDTRFHLRTGSRLSIEAPGAEDCDGFRYDPSDPVPTVGGNTLLRDGGRFLGPRDRRRVQGRPDVLVYTSEPLEQDTEVTGFVTATLHVSTSATDTDFTVALLDVHPDGRAIGIADGILRLRYRDGLDTPAPATPGVVYRIEIDLVATSNVFRAGHRIGVEVSSSNFPRFDRNPNHGGVIAEADRSDFVVAEQSVFHDADRPSWIALPIVPT